jgi:hypothetical protein
VGVDVDVGPLLAIPVLRDVPELTPTDGTEDDGAAEGTIAGAGLTDSGRVTLVCLID